jgi:Zn-dependent protease
MAVERSSATRTQKDSPTRGGVLESAPLSLGRRVMGFGEDPLGWSIPLASCFGVRVRLHLVFMAWIAAELITSLRPDSIGPVHVASAVVAFVLVVVLREVARVPAMRAAGLSDATVTLWPLGAVDVPSAADRPRPRVRVALAGIAASAAITLASAWTLVAISGSAALLALDPFHASATISNMESPLLVLVWWIYAASVVVLAANLLLPAPGFDLGRLVQAMASRQPESAWRAARMIAHLGIAVAVAVFVLGAVGGMTRVMGAAALAGLLAFLELRRAIFVESTAMPWRPGSSALLSDFAPTPQPRARQPLPMESAADASRDPTYAERPDTDGDVELIEQALSERPVAGIDEILAKISRQGLSSLNEDERARLDAERDRLRA